MSRRKERKRPVIMACERAGRTKGGREGKRKRCLEASLQKEGRKKKWDEEGEKSFASFLPFPFCREKSERLTCYEKRG